MWLKSQHNGRSGDFPRLLDESCNNEGVPAMHPIEVADSDGTATYLGRKVIGFANDIHA
jgi:hypothetical protein